MTLLTAKFNAKAQISRREETETERFGGHKISQYFCALSLRKKIQPKVEVQQVKVVVEVPVPVRALRAPLPRI